MALDSNVVDILATGSQDLLNQLDGREVQMTVWMYTLHVADADIVRYEMAWKDKVLTVITNPTIAFILFNIGWMGLLLELYNPGSLVPGIVAASACCWPSSRFSSCRSTTRDWG